MNPKHGEPGHIEHVTACAGCADEWAKRTNTADLIGAVLDLLDAAALRDDTTPAPLAQNPGDSGGET